MRKASRCGSGSPVMAIIDTTSTWVEANFKETDLSHMRPGQPAELTLDAYPENPFPAHVITTIPAADREKATVQVRIGFDALDPRILPDMGVKVAFLSAAATQLPSGVPW